MTNDHEYYSAGRAADDAHPNVYPKSRSHSLTPVPPEEFPSPHSKYGYTRHFEDIRYREVRGRESGLVREPFRISESGPRCIKTRYDPVRDAAQAHQTATYDPALAPGTYSPTFVATSIGSSINIPKKIHKSRVPGPSYAPAPQSITVSQRASTSNVKDPAKKLATAKRIAKEKAPPRSVPSNPLKSKKAIVGAKASTSTSTAISRYRRHNRSGNNNPEARRILLENDHWCENVREHNVFCRGCKSDITLESRRDHRYYTFEWEKHRSKNCAGIKAKLEYLYMTFQRGRQSAPSELVDLDHIIADQYWSDDWVCYVKDRAKSPESDGPRPEPLWMTVHKMAVEQDVPGFRRAGNGQRHKIGDVVYVPGKTIAQLAENDEI